MDDGIGHADTAQQHTEEVEDPRKDHRPIGRHGLGIDDGGDRVGGVVETVDELECQDECQGETEAQHQPGIKPAEEIEHESCVTGS
ncbi:hypothetical protein D3C84_1196730 [compost metagenome]